MVNSYQLTTNFSVNCQITPVVIGQSSFHAKNEHISLPGIHNNIKNF